MNTKALLFVAISAFALHCVPGNSEAASPLRLRIARSAPGTCADDGAAAAPAATIQYPSLLNGYAARSPCGVAGVDYAVGVPDGTTLKDPSNPANLPAGVTYNAAQKSVRCGEVATPNSGVVLEGFDFSLNGGVGINVLGCRNLIIRNNVFKIGANCVRPINQTGSVPFGIVIEYNTFSGGGGSTSTSCAVGSVGETVTLSSTTYGDKVFRYNWVKDVEQHFMDFSGVGAIDVRYNLFERCGYFQGSHCNGFQIVGGQFDGPLFAYNTYYSPQPDTSTGSVTGSFVAGSATFTATFRGATSENSLKAGQRVSGVNLPPGTTVLSGSTVSGVTTVIASAQATTTGSFAFEVENAYPSGLVIPMRFVAQLGGQISGGIIRRNTIVNTGPLPVTSYSIYCAASDTGTNVNATLSENFIDTTATFGAFYPSSLCAPRVVSGNVNMVTGEIIPGPP